MKNWQIHFASMLTPLHTSQTHTHHRKLNFLSLFPPKQLMTNYKVKSNSLGDYVGDALGLVNTAAHVASNRHAIAGELSIVLDLCIRQVPHLLVVIAALLGDQPLLRRSSVASPAHQTFSIRVFARVPGSDGLDDVLLLAGLEMNVTSPKA